VILLLIQIGGLGVITVVIAVSVFSGKRIGLRQRNLMQNAVNAPKIGGIIRFTRFLLFFTAVSELAGAVVLTPVFAREYGIVPGIHKAVFHSISAFCNAGFDILGFREPGVSFMQVHTDPVICITAAALVILGGLGFLVWDDVLREKDPRRWNVYTRLVLVTTGVLLLGGMLSVCVLEWNNPATLGSLPFGQKLLAAFFQSMTLRTAGFAGLDQSLLTPAGKAVSIFLMLIGGSSCSTAGGLKTVTFVVLLMFLWNRMRGRYTVSVFHRTISDDHVLNAIMIFILMITLSFIGATVICATSDVEFGDSLFETVSALATVGLSAGVTPRLSLPARIMIIIFMYFGRVGVLTLSVGFLKKKPAGEKYTYAHTDLLIG
jgi:trk system potassium uptake protein TrkH